VRVLVAECEVFYAGRVNAHLPLATRLVLFKADGSVMVHADSGGFKPLNWMTPPVVVEESSSEISVRKPKSGEELKIEVKEVLVDQSFELTKESGLTKDMVEADLQRLLAEQPHWCGEGFRLVRREWPTDVGPVDLMCRDEQDSWIAVEIKRIATVDAVEQLTRYLEQIHKAAEMASCRGVLVAQKIKPQTYALAESRGIECVEVDIDVLRGEKEADLTLFTTA